MKRFLSLIFLLGGVGFSLAAFPVFGQTGEVEINKAPLKDFAEFVKDQNIDWTKSFLLEAETVLRKDGKFDKEKTKFTKTEGDAELIEIVKRAFEAAGESGYFGYLGQQGVKEIKLSASQNSEIFSISILNEQPTRERAATISSALSAIVQAVLLADKMDWKKLGADEKKLLSGTKVTVQEKTVNINVSLAASDFQEMARRATNRKQETTAK